MPGLSRITLPSEFQDVADTRLLMQPEPGYFWARLAAVAQEGAELMRSMSPLGPNESRKLMTQGAEVPDFSSMQLDLRDRAAVAAFFEEVRPEAVFLAAAKTTAVIMFLVAAAMVSAWMITVANLPDQVINLLQPLLDRPTLLMFAIMILCMIVGTAMDMTPTILILTPVLMPLIKAAGIDPVYFGVLFIINNSIGLVTPPVGTVLNVVAGVGRMRMDDVTRGVVPFMAVQFAVMFLMVLFPQIVMVPARWFY